MATIFYARVSTLEQTLDHQVTQAKAAGFVIDEVIADHGDNCGAGGNADDLSVLDEMLSGKGMFPNTS